MADYHDAKIHNWWFDEEFNEYVTMLETTNGELRLVTTKKEDKI